MITDQARIGATGEKAATKWLRQRGFLIRELNWRAGRYELDIIAQKWEVVHFIEVKTRKANSLTTPEAAMTREKFNAISHAARAYVSKFKVTNEIQFDLVAVDIMPDGEMEIRFIEKVMEFRW